MAQPFQVIITADLLTELREIFQIVILSNFILTDGSGIQVSLTDQERSRITSDLDISRVFIIDANSKFYNYAYINIHDRTTVFLDNEQEQQLALWMLTIVSVKLLDQFSLNSESSVETLHSMWM